MLHPSYTLPSSAKDILYFNPLMHTIELSRHALFPLYHSDGMNLVYPSLFAIVSLVLGVIVFRAHRLTDGLRHDRERLGEPIRETGNAHGRAFPPGAGGPHGREAPR